MVSRIAVFETVRLEPDGVRLLSSHLARAARAGAGLEAEARAALARLLPSAPLVVRLDFTADGLVVGQRPVPSRSATRLALTGGYDPADVRRERKAVDRGWADGPLARARAAGADDALLTAPDGLLGETTLANVVVELADGTLVTPPASGLLSGVTRAFAIRELDVVERVLGVADLATARAVVLANAVRGLWPVDRVDAWVIDSAATASRLHARWLELPLEAP